MTDCACAELLRWLLPRLRLRPAGFRRVRNQVCKRLARRARELGLPSLSEYRSHLETHPGEWRVADSLCTVTISRFFRDRGVFVFLAETVLPALVDRARSERRSVLRAWSAGCGSGEEPYSVSLLWDLQVGKAFPDVSLEIMATDRDEQLLARARESVYPAGCLRELPEPWRAEAFVEDAAGHRLRSRYRRRVELLRHDVRDEPIDGPFDLVLCRNLAFTYFDEPRQVQAARTLCSVMREGAVLVLGRREGMPAGAEGFAAWPGAPQGVYGACW